MGLIEEAKNAHALADLGVVFLLFLIGLELSFERLRTMRRFVFGLGFVQVLTCGVVIGVVSSLVLAVGGSAAVVIGGALALSSTAFVMQLLADRGELVTRTGRIAFAILLFQDLAVVPMLAFLPMLKYHEGSVFNTLALAILNGLVAVGLMLLLGRTIMRPLFRGIAGTRNPELFIAATLLLIFTSGMAMQWGGLSMGMGAFLCGLLLSETEYRHQIESDIRPFKGMLLGLFFMTVGMGLNLHLVGSHTLLILALLVGLITLKSGVIALLCRAFALPWSVALQTGLVLAQGGEFAFVLFNNAGGDGLLNPDTTQLLTAVVMLSMIATPFLAILGHRLFERLQLAEMAEPDLKDQLTATSNHVIIAGFGRVGQTIAKVLSAANIPYVALDLDLKKVNQCRTHGLTVFYGDASRLKLIDEAGASNAKAVVITLDNPTASGDLTEDLRKKYPTLPIIVRAADQACAHRLRGVGATAVVPDTFEASLQLGTIVLNETGITQHDATALVNNFRRTDYEALEDVVETPDSPIAPRRGRKMKI